MENRFLFRVFDYDENKMVYFSSLIGIETPHHDRSSQPNLYNDYVYHKISNYMQATGLRDNNEKNIFEGDIIKITHTTPFGDNIEKLCIVEYSRCCFWAKTNDMSVMLYHEDNKYEVVGNIYENKELLKEQK